MTGKERKKGVEKEQKKLTRAKNARGGGAKTKSDGEESPVASPPGIFFSTEG